MLRNRIYYRIKPLVPTAIRMSVRRWYSARKRNQVSAVWPILPGSEAAPPNWGGWPGGKKFALVLTHDVESQAGLDKCLQLMKLDREFGFRSAFNFIPEGGYTVSNQLHGELRQNGFEVGVHDLHHDGRLYLSRKKFRKNSVRINHYLKEWGATGFRSGFMLHNLAWLHDLNIEYDCSTFDTDPFEPQPHGRNTIFPFWVPAPKMPLTSSSTATSDSSGRPGYVELPYTLPQDSTLFLLLRERHPDIWFQKLDWLAQNGGMAMVNVHPDYLRFDGERSSNRTYSASLYREFLEYVNQRYSGSFWHPLPGEMAKFCSAIRPSKSGGPRRRICMVSYSSYQTDNRVIRYAETLARRGDSVDVLALKRDPSHSNIDVMGGVRIHCIQGRYSKNEKSKSGYLLPLLKFCFLSCFWLTRKHFRQRYDLIHIHNIPDFLVFTTFLAKLSGAKVILDIHDVVPEFYASKFHLKPDAFGVKALKKVERVSARFADHVIISNHLWRNMFVARSVPAHKCSVFINNVNQKIFYRRQLPQKVGSGPVLLFPGGLHWHQGLDIAINAMPEVLRKIPSAEFHIYGDGNMKVQLMDLVQKLKLGAKVRFFDPLPVTRIAEVMSQVDLGVVPKRADSFGNEAYSTKIMEFMSLGVPVVVSSTRIDRFYFDDSVVRFFESGNSEALARAIVEILQNHQLRAQMVARALEYADRNSWEARKFDYLELVDSLIEKRPAIDPGTDAGAINPVASGSSSELELVS